MRFSLIGEFADSRRRASHPLAKVRPQLADVVARNVVRDDQGPSPEDGYHASAGVGKVDDPRGASFAVRAGGKSKNYGKLENRVVEGDAGPGDCDV